MILTDKIIRKAPKCDECVARKLSLLKKKSFKDPANLISFKSKIISYYKTCCLTAWSAKISKNVDPKVIKTKNNSTMLSSKCAVCGSKKPIFMKEHEASRLSSSSCIEALLSDTPLLDKILF